MAICEASVPGGPNREACDQHQVRVGLELHGQPIQDSERMLVDPSIERGLIPFGLSAEDAADHAEWRWTSLLSHRPRAGCTPVPRSMAPRTSRIAARALAAGMPSARPSS